MGFDPKRPCNANQPSTHPGTLTASGPLAGICVRPRRFSSASVIARADRPLALRPYNCFVFASQTTANRSPPMPLLPGSPRPRKALAAMAASTALPPSFRTSSAICVANGWLVATIPLRATTSDRDAKPRPESRSCATTAVPRAAATSNDIASAANAANVHAHNPSDDLQVPHVVAAMPCVHVHQFLERHRATHGVHEFAAERLVGQGLEQPRPSLVRGGEQCERQLDRRRRRVRQLGPAPSRRTP